MKIRVSETEVPVYYIVKDGGTLCDIPQDLLERWIDTANKHEALEYEIAQYVKHGERIVQDSSTITPRHPLAPEIQKQILDELLLPNPS